MLKLRDRTRKSDKLQLLTRTYIKPTNKLVKPLSGALLVLGQATGDFGPTRFIRAWTRGEPSPSPIQYYLCLHETSTSEWLFIPRLPRRSPETTKVWTPATLRDYNSFFRPLIGTRSKEKLQLSSRAFQWCAPLHLHASRSGRFSTFSGRESNCQFDSRPFFWP